MSSQSNTRIDVPTLTTPMEASQIAVAAASLAAHFARLGIHFGPNPTESGIAEFDQLLHVAEPESIIAESPPAIPAAPPQQSRPTPVPPPAAVTHRSQRVAAVASGGTDYERNPLPLAERESKLAQLQQLVSGCTRCEVLSRCRTQTVFGEGTAKPRVAFFGEGPGADEDRSGRPFVGKAGQLLTKMIEACTFKREDVYILNTVKCRPPENRNPDPGEIQNCREYFESQLEILRPEYIVCLGAVSSQALLSSTLSVGRLRGKFHRYRESKVIVTYHPAYLLRAPEAKRAAWEDLQKMLRDMGIDPTRRS